MVRELPAVFDRNKPLGLFVLNPAAENFASQTKGEKPINHLLKPEWNSLAKEKAVEPSPARAVLPD
jgi:hypothetical protein